MHFLFNTGFYKPSTHTGGPIYSVSALAESLVKRGHCVTVAAVRNKADSCNCDQSRDYVLNGVHVRLFDSVPYLWQKLPMSRLKQMSVSRLDHNWERWLNEIMPSVDVCDSQLGFLYSNRAVSRISKKHAKIYLYHQRGNLDPRRFGANALFKRVYLNLFEKPILTRADVLIALSQREAEVFRAYVPSSRVEVIPNGVDCREWLLPAVAEGELADVFLRIGDAPLVIWHSRMVKMKGPDVFVRAFARAQKKQPSLQAILAGPNEEGLREECEMIAQEMGVTDCVYFMNALSGSNRRALLQRADLFVLPTAGEGLSMAILEAMACGCAVVTTPEANISEIQACGAGSVVACNELEIGNAIVEMFSESVSGLAARKANARALVDENFSLTGVVDRYLELVERILAES
ncbi:glycosyltransferase [Coraliomargarita sp. SDUM461003]|uniref:Glycosyltransferase n=1 Tax=Thalassobacterium maritimum TaxID=3041265 RepID=A0ABU1B0S9_9BACT|nr:glycosyltransferase [Coraliomargarita sp. SDUM461003]MDQ8209154.1 glycosyltransferase [Coraliomargarita sp. SDUM461003]